MQVVHWYFNKRKLKKILKFVIFCSEGFKKKNSVLIFKVFYQIRIQLHTVFVYGCTASKTLTEEGDLKFFLFGLLKFAWLEQFGCDCLDSSWTWIRTFLHSSKRRPVGQLLTNWDERPNEPEDSLERIAAIASVVSLIFFSPKTFLILLCFQLFTRNSRL